MHNAAGAALLGIDPLAVARCTDPTERLFMEALVRKAAEMAQKRDRNLAQRIAYETVKQLARAMK